MQTVNKKFKIWGLEVEEIFVDGRIWWKIYIKRPFYYKDGWRIGLNEKLFKEARRRGVEKFIIQIGRREVLMDVPPERFLKQKVKNGDYEDKPSMFENSPPMRIYYFYAR